MKKKVNDQIKKHIIIELLLMALISFIGAMLVYIAFVIELF